jgi:hypothetical protein
MILHLSENESLTAVLAATPTTQPTYLARWRDAAGTLNESVGSLTGATAKTLVETPGRAIEALQIYNADAAAVTLTLAKVSGGTSYTIAKPSIPVGGTLHLSAGGLQVTDSAGQLLQTVSDVTGTVGVAATDVVAAESGSLVRKTVLTLTNVSVTAANTTGVSFGGTKIYDFPDGRILVLGVTIADVVFDLTDAGNVTPIAGADGGDIALGTTAPTDGTLTNTDVDLLPSTSIDPISDGVAGAALAASAQFDGTGTAKDMFFNILIDDADVADGASDVLLVNATVTVHWVLLGNY